MSRIEHLNKHLESLMRLSGQGDFQEEIKDTVKEINEELGLGTTPTLKSYTTKELQEELSTRDSIEELLVSNTEEVNVEVITGDAGKHHSYQGPARILVNQD